VTLKAEVATLYSDAAGRVETSRAAVCAQIQNVRLRLLDQQRRWFEADELLARIEALEAEQEEEVAARGDREASRRAGTLRRGAPYQIAHMAKGSPNEVTQMYFVMSTWNPYQVVLMTTSLSVRPLESPWQPAFVPGSELWHPPIRVARRSTG
jgi:hypothetical protein